MNKFNNSPRQRVWHFKGDEDGCQGNWVCAKCKENIERLPFSPDPNRLNSLLCLNCHRNRRGLRR